MAASAEIFPDEKSGALLGPQSIAARKLKKKYGDRTVVDGVDFDVRRGEVVGLLGPNGAGKTTSFYMIMGLVRPDGGQVLLDEKNITYWPMHQRAQSGIGYLAQNESIFRRLSVEDNIRAILETHAAFARAAKSALRRVAGRF